MDFCSIASGSSGNCIYIGSDENSVLVDAGVSCRRITEGLKGIGRCLNDLTGILITHEHSDHIQGLGVLSRKAHIPIYGTAATLRQIRRYNPIGTVDRNSSGRSGRMNLFGWEIFRRPLFTSPMMLQIRWATGSSTREKLQRWRPIWAATMNIPCSI